MALRYIDKDGEVMSEVEWRKLSRSAKYCLLKRSDLPDKTVVMTTWLGVFLPERERVPMIFVTTVKCDRKDKKDEYHWHPTDRAALADHEAIVRRLKGGG